MDVNACTWRGICVCMRVYLGMCVQANVCVHADVYADRDVCTCMERECICVCMHEDVCVWKCMGVYAWAQGCARICVCIHRGVFMYLCVCMGICVPMCARTSPAPFHCGLNRSSPPFARA